VGVTVTFPTAFSSAPQVIVTANGNTSGQSSAVILQCGAATTTDVIVRGFYTFTSSFSGNVSFSWFAYN
jgi:hypothetical protein